MLYATKLDARVRICGQHHIHIIIQHMHSSRQIRRGWCGGAGEVHQSTFTRRWDFGEMLVPSPSLACVMDTAVEI